MSDLPTSLAQVIAAAAIQREIDQPDHPGKNIGDWWTHPLIRGELLGHSVAAYLPHDTEEPPNVKD